ncbi:MAG: hypothetical protein RMJ54_14280 [Roseiflexaceae bacterium]|nr:hypothetical protein [Roseiflexaceae bacterium]
MIDGSFVRQATDVRHPQRRESFRQQRTRLFERQQIGIRLTEHQYPIAD